MQKTILSLVLSVASVSAAYAFGAVETLPGAASGAFQALSGFRARTAVRSLDAIGTPQPAAPVAGTRRISLRGYVHVSGDAYAQPGSSVWLEVSGTTYLQDETGRTLNGLITVSDRQWFHVNGGYVNGWVRPAAHVSIYKGGQYLGSVRIEGWFPVSGSVYNGWLRVNGSGWVEGSGVINEPAEPQAP